MKRFAVCLLVLVASAVVLAVSSAPAYAVDGVVLINQNTATSGGLPGCPTGGTFPIIICNPGSYRLSGNLTITGNTDAIDIKADDVTLDLNGFGIIGPVTCDGDELGNPTTSCTGSAGAGVSSSNHRITIRNGVIKGMGFGINLGRGSSLIEEIQAVQNGAEGIDAIASVIRRSTAVNNGRGGIFADTATISDNVVTGNHGVGIVASNSTVIGNTSSGNGADGINVFSATVLNNSSINNKRFGLAMGNTLYGSNTLSTNFAGNVSAFGSVSQGNNFCSGSSC